MELLGRFKDPDGSLKTVLDVNKKIIEITLLQNRIDTDVICAPTHHFCNLGCKMCHLTNNKLNKKMIPINENDFIEALKYSVCINNKKITNKKILLISFMGVGEPLLNINLLKSIFLKQKELCKILGYEKIGFALSTMMPNDNIKELTDFVNQHNIPLKIHFSLHSPIEQKRKEIIPSSTLTINEIVKLLSDYQQIIKSNKNIMNERELPQTVKVCGFC